MKKITTLARMSRSITRAMSRHSQDKCYFVHQITVGFFLIVISCKYCHVSTAERFNVTRLLEEFYSQAEHRARTVGNSGTTILARDVSYLPENDYLEAYEIDDDESAGLDRPDRNLLPEYRSLCEIVTRKIQMSDTEYEYQPPYHHEVFCKSYSLFDEARKKAVKPAKQRCAHPGFHCVQRSRTLFMVRRRWEGDCWEPFTKEIASGCDCMWPVSSLGEISAHY